VETETAISQVARHDAIRNAPEHSEHTVRRTRVDIWKDEQTGVYIACVPEMMTQGTTPESALAAADGMIKVKAQFALGLMPPAVQNDQANQNSK
jgi:hypothetical protein